jgi:hypothetical protein
MDASGASGPGDAFACERFGVASRLDARATVAGFAISATSPIPCAMQGGAGPRAASAIAFTGRGYGKISKIALVWPGNLKGIVNKAFTMSAALRSWCRFATNDALPFGHAMT